MRLGHWDLRERPAWQETFRKSDHVAGPRTDHTLMPSITDFTRCAVIRKHPTLQLVASWMTPVARSRASPPGTPSAAGSPPR
jgi:hypothetical protein